MELTQDNIVKVLFDFIVDGGNHGGLSGLEADLHNLPLIKQIMDNKRDLIEYKFHDKNNKQIIKLLKDNNKLSIDIAEKYKEKIDKIKDIIALFENTLEFNMFGTVEIKSVTKRLKDIIQ